MRMAFEMCGSFWRSAKKQLEDDFLLAFFFFWFVVWPRSYPLLLGGASFLHLLYKYIYLRLWKREPFVAWQPEQRRRTAPPATHRHPIHLRTDNDSLFRRQGCESSVAHKKMPEKSHVHYVDFYSAHVQIIQLSTARGQKKKSSGYNDHSGRNLLRSPINMSRCHFILIIQSGVSGFIRPECRSPGRRDRCVALAVATGSITKVFRSRFKFIRSEMLLQCFGE